MRRLLISSGVAVIALVAFAAWQLGLFSSDPAEVSLAETVAAVAREEAEIQADATDDPTADSSATTAPATRTDPLSDNGDDATDVDDSAEGTDGIDTCSLDPVLPDPTGNADVPESTADLDGTWLVESGDQTFVGYRIDEILSGVDFTAVGRSPGVVGSVTIDDGSLTAARIVANLSWLTSDSRIRDEQMKSQALQTQRFPAACFELVEPVSLPDLPTDGASVTLSVSGTFTIHGVAQPHTLDLEATTVAERLVIVGSTTVALADHDIDTPSAPAVAGVSDTATIELSLVLRR